MRPQMISLRIIVVVFLMCSIASSEQVTSALDFQNKMRAALRFQNSKNVASTADFNENSLSLLTSYVQQLSYGDLVYLPELRNQGFPEAQLACQQAIAHGSIFYVRRWIDATERGMAPEAADRFAARQLEGVTAACNVSVVANSSGFTIPSAGGPCAFAASQGFVKAEELHSCLQRTLEFWTSYLYIPANQ